MFVRSRGSESHPVCDYLSCFPRFLSSYLPIRVSGVCVSVLTGLPVPTYLAGSEALRGTPRASDDETYDCPARTMPAPAPQPGPKNPWKKPAMHAEDDAARKAAYDDYIRSTLTTEIDDEVLAAAETGDRLAMLLIDVARTLIRAGLVFSADDIPDTPDDRMSNGFGLVMTDEPNPEDRYVYLVWGSADDEADGILLDAIADKLRRHGFIVTRPDNSRACVITERITGAVSPRNAV